MTIQQAVAQANDRLTSQLRRVSRPAQRVWPRVPEALLGMLAVAVIAVALLTYFTPLSVAASKLPVGNQYVALLDGYLNPFRSRHLLMDAGLPVYDLSIGSKEYAEIQAVIEEAKQRGWMTADLKAWVPARFIYQNREYNVKVRVRGDLPNHWTGPKKSWAINFGSEQVQDGAGTREEPIPFAGRDQINLIIPIDRDFVVAPFVNDLMSDEGLTVPHDQFVVLRINGRLQGLYYEVEQMDNPLFAAGERPETAVFEQSDRAMHFEQYTRLGAAGASDAEFDLGAMQLAVDPTDDLALREMQVLIDYVRRPTAEGFRRARQVLDWDKYLRFRALTTLFNTNHVRFGSDNLKLYHDPSRGLLEPIPWDVHVVRYPVEPGTIDYWNSHGPDALQRATLLDPELRRQRNKILWDWVGDGGRRIMARYDALHDRIRPYAWADVLVTPIQAFKMDQRRKDFEFNVRRAHKVLGLSLANLTYRLEAPERASIEVTVPTFSGIRLQSLTISDPPRLWGRYQLLEDANDDGQLDPADPVVAEAVAAGGAVQLALDRALYPELTYDSDTIDGTAWEYYDTLLGRTRYFLVGRLAPPLRDPLVWQAPEITATAVNAVSGQPLTSAVLSPSDPLPENTIGITAYDASDPFDLAAIEASATEFLARHPQFRASRQHPGAVELGGTVAISDTVIVPQGVPLILRPGADITLGPGVDVLMYGGLTALGTPERPIHLHGLGPDQPWGTFAVVRPPETVVLHHVQIQHGGQAQVNGMLFTGGFAVHDGDLELDHVQVTDMQSEDGINLKNGHIDLRDSLIARTASDAIDIDFGQGRVEGNRFQDIAGDGVDLSGSTVTVAGNRFERIGDKGTSAGESSHPILVNNLYRECHIGVSTKDLSHARVAYSTFVDNHLAIEGKRKKPMFGGATGEFAHNVFSGNAILLEEDYFSTGQVALSHSLVDGPVDPRRCRECRSAEVRFRDPEQGDFRLATDSSAQAQVTQPAPGWAQVGSGGLPTQPGIFAELASTWLPRE